MGKPNREDLKPGIDTAAVYSSGTGTITSANWTANTGDYALKLNHTIAGIVDTDWVDVVIDKDYHDTAADAELCPTLEEYNGGITFFAQTAPAVDIPFKWKLVK